VFFVIFVAVFSFSLSPSLLCFSSDVCKGIMEAHQGLGKVLGGLKGANLFEAGSTVEGLAGYINAADPPTVEVRVKEGEDQEEGEESVVAKKVQRALTKGIFKELKHGLLSPVTKEHYNLQVTIRSCKEGTVSNSWMTRFGHADRFGGIAFSWGKRFTRAAFAAEEFRAVLQLWLHLSDPFLNEACRRFNLVKCACGRRMRENGWVHFLSCKFGGFGERHDEVVRLLVFFAREAGLLTRDTQTFPGDQGRG
jgi:hypothetical protein